MISFTDQNIQKFWQNTSIPLCVYIQYHSWQYWRYRMIHLWYPHETGWERVLKFVNCLWFYFFKQWICCLFLPREWMWGHKIGYFLWMAKRYNPYSHWNLEICSVKPCGFGGTQNFMFCLIHSLVFLASGSLKKFLINRLI